MSTIECWLFLTLWASSKSARIVINKTITASAAHTTLLSYDENYRHLHEELISTIIDRGVNHEYCYGHHHHHTVMVIITIIQNVTDVMTITVSINVHIYI